MFTAALTSRSCTAPQTQTHSRTCKGIDVAIAPHPEHNLEEGNQRSIRANVRPYSFALYSSMATNELHPASCTLLASLVRASPLTARSST